MKTLFSLVLLSSALLASKCPGDLQCSSCGNTGGCERCIDSFYTENGCDTAVTPIAHCWGYDGKDTCNECDFGFVVKANTCQACKVAGCALCDDLDTCNACHGGVVTDGKTCAATLPKCSQENCDVCVDKDICSVCKDGFAINKLDQCETAPKDCFISENSLCLACHSGFYITEKGTCEVVATRASSHKLLYLFIGLLIIGAVVAIIFFVTKKKNNDDYTRTEPY